LSLRRSLSAGFNTALLIGVMMAQLEEEKPPVARKVPMETTVHGQTLVDNYFWIRERSNPGVIEYIGAENRYTEHMMKHTEGLQEKLFGELKSRIVETDSTVPAKVDDYYYYSRTEKGKQFQILCRKHGSLDTAEEVLLDVNKLAEGNEFFNVDIHKVSPDHAMLAYLADTSGSERHTLYIKDLRTGNVLTETMTDTAAVEWSNDSKAIFYAVIDKENRPDRVLRHVLGTDPKEDVEVFRETDKMFYYLQLEKTKSRAFITITIESSTTSEVHYLDANKPLSPFKVFSPRKHGVKYFLNHGGDRFFIVTDEDARNFKVMEVPILNPAKENWKEFIPHDDEVTIDVSDPVPFVEIFREYMALFVRKKGVSSIRVVDLNNRTSHTVALPEELHTIEPGENPDSASHTLRFVFSSMVTPTTVYDYDMKERKLVVRKRFEVPGYTPSDFSTERIWGSAKDGTMVPITLIYRKGMKRNGGNPCYMYAYGAYGDFEGASPQFNRNWISLLNRGFVCAHAHVRGGGDLGKVWHEQGRVLTKRTTFEDFISCAEHLVKEGYTSPDKLAIRGRSAGGLLMGSVVTMRPDLFKVVVAEVPFVDAINTMLDDTIPLTAGEFEEWGDPKIKEHFDYIRSYSPYDNIRATAYPNMLVTSGWNDARVQYWEPTKFVAKLRAMKTDENLLMLRTNIVQGHSGAPGRYDMLKYYAFMYAFILDRLGIKE
jgi:oligopeptidase B